jgi:hypothetical protein
MRFCDGCGTPQTELAVNAAEPQATDLLATLERPVKSSMTSPARISQDLLISAFLFTITALTIYPLFLGEFTTNWGSIESAYISDSIFITTNFPNVGWFPFWYGGLPLHVSYAPLFIYAVAILHDMSGLSVPYSYRILTAIGYSAAPAVLYFFAKFLTKSRLAGFLAGLTYSFVPTFIPLPYSTAPSHIGILTVYGEGPHLFGFTLSLLAIWLMLRCMAKPTSLRILLGAVTMASVALTNLIALYGLALLVVCAVATEVIYRNDPGIRAFAVAGLITCGLVAFQYTPSFIMASAPPPVSPVSASNALRYSILMLSALALIVILVRRRFSGPLSLRPNTKASFFVIFWLILLGTIMISYVWFNLIPLAPQPQRYVPEFDAGVASLIGLIVAKVDRTVFGLPTLSGRIKWARWTMVAGVILILVLVNTLFLLPVSLSVTQPSPSVADVPEYRIATWLSTHVKDESIFATGTVGFWLNVFSNVRQIRGGSDQAVTNTWATAVSYQILTGSNPQISILWAQAWNVKYIVVTYPNASTAYHDYVFPNKFEGILPMPYYYEGNGIFEVQLNHPGLAEAVSATKALSLNPISDVLDTRDLLAYVRLSQNETNSTATVNYAVVNPDMLTLSITNAIQDTAILVKMTYDPGWSADLNGTPINIFPFGPDFMITYPQSLGNYQLTFHFERSTQELIGLVVTLAFIVILIARSANVLRRRPPRSRTTP